MNSCLAQYFDGLVAKPNPVTIAFSGECWLIEGEGVHLSVPTSEIEIPPRVGGITRFLRLASGARCEVADADFERIASPQNLPPPNRSLNLITRLERRAKTVALMTVLIGAAATGSFFWIMPQLTARLARSLPGEFEQKISRSTLATLDANFFDPSGLGSRRETAIRLRFDTFLLATHYHGKPLRLVFRRMVGDSANAFALPNGTIVVTDGLVHLARNDEQIMAVLSHEIGHIENHHAVRMLLQDSATLVLVTALTGDTSVVGNVAGALPLILTSKKFSREFEAEADRYALAALNAAEIRPQKFVEIMESLENDKKQHEADAIPRYLSTHPPTEERLKRFRSASQTP